MSLDSITRKIIEDARTRAAAIDAEAASHEKSVLAAARERVHEISKSAGRSAEEEAARIIAEAKAGAEIEANSMLLEARGAAVEHAMPGLLALVRRELLKSRLKAILDSGIRQFKALSEGEMVIATYGKGAQLIKGKQYKTEKGSAEGFMLYSADRKVALDATIDGVVRHRSDYARSVLAAELFGTKMPTQRKKAVKRPVQKAAKGRAAKKAAPKRRRKG